MCWLRNRRAPISWFDSPTDANPARERALFSELGVTPARPVSTPRFVFLDARAREFYADWGRADGETVAVLRAEAARDPVVGDLSVN